MSATRDLFQAVFQNSSIGMAVIRPDGAILEANPAFEETAGLTSRDHQSASFWDLLTRTDGTRSRERAAALNHAGERHSWLVSVGGKRRKWQLDVSVIGDDKDEPLLLVNVRDVTLQKAAERGLKKAKDSAERATRTKSAFLANMSHEIRTPITTITSVTELLADTELDAEQREYASQVGFSAEMLLGLVNDILDFSRIEAGKLTLETIDFHLAHVTEEAVGMLSLEAHKKGLEAVVAIGEGIPRKVKGDPSRLRQIIVNLFNNAVKFTHHGQILLTLSVPHADESCARVRFEVTDSGIGIPREKLDRLFTAFHQVDSSTSRKYGGTGLGLSICQSLVEMMGGTIGVRSVEHRGSTFWFEIPLPVVEPPVPDEPILEECRVLLIDDNAVSRDVLMGYLRRWGAEVVTAETGEDALESLTAAAAKGSPYDLAIVDLELPGIDGWQLASEINADEVVKGTALILLAPTGKMGGDAKMKRLHWFNGYANKPIRMDELAAEIENSLATELEPLEADVPERENSADLQAGARPAKLLVAEDHLVNQKLFQAILEKLGHEVVLASNGHEAVAAVARETPDLVFMDVQMPEMNGHEATVAIRSAGYAGPIVAVTANVLKGERDKALESGMNDFLTKPFKRDDLVPILLRWLPQEDGERGGTAEDDPDGAGRPVEGADGDAAESDSFAVPAEYVAGKLFGEDAEIFVPRAALARFMGQSELLRTVIDEFAGGMSRTLDEMEAQLESGDFAQLHRGAHGIKGSAWSLEARRLGDAAALLEASAKLEDPKRCRHYLSLAREEALALATAVEAVAWESLNPKGQA